MIKPVYRMIYRSRPTLTVADKLNDEVDRIIESSVYRNYSVGLTGLLISAKGFFVQALEGGCNEVRSTYGRIALDRRHRDLCIICQGFVQNRLFAEWAMCAGHLLPSDGRIVNSLWSRADYRPEKLNAGCAERLLVSVADLQRKAKNEVWI